MQMLGTCIVLLGKYPARLDLFLRSGQMLLLLFSMFLFSIPFPSEKSAFAKDVDEKGRGPESCRITCVRSRYKVRALSNVGR